MATRYQTRILERDTGRIIGSPIDTDQQFIAHVGETYIFDEHHSAVIRGVSHYVVPTESDTTIFTMIFVGSVQRSNDKPNLDQTYDRPVPWPWVKE